MNTSGSDGQRLVPETQMEQDMLYRIISDAVHGKGSAVFVFTESMDTIDVGNGLFYVDDGDMESGILAGHLTISLDSDPVFLPGEAIPARFWVEYRPDGVRDEKFRVWYEISPSAFTNPDEPYSNYMPWGPVLCRHSDQEVAA